MTIDEHSRLPEVEFSPMVIKTRISQFQKIIGACNPEEDKDLIDHYKTKIIRLKLKV